MAEFYTRYYIRDNNFHRLTIRLLFLFIVISKELGLDTAEEHRLLDHQFLRNLVSSNNDFSLSLEMTA
jgi:hypothetical protein